MKKLTSITLVLTVIAAMLTGLSITASADQLEQGLYSFACVDGGRYLNVYAGWDWDGVNVCVWDSDGSNEQKFKMVDRGGNKYVLYPQSSGGRVLDANRGNSYWNPLQAGNNVDIWQTNDAPAQEWYIDDQGGGKYRISLVSNYNLVLTCDNPWGNGGNVSIQNYTGANNQLWYLKRLDGGVASGNVTEKYKSIVSQVGYQTQYKYTDSAAMCGAYCMAYAKSYMDNYTHSATEFWGSSGAIWSGASTWWARASNWEVLSAAKNAVDNGKPAIVTVNSSSWQHFLLVISYTGSGTNMQDFTVVDPWDGQIKNLGQFTIHSYNKQVITF